MRAALIVLSLLFAATRSAFPTQSVGAQKARKAAPTNAKTADRIARNANAATATTRGAVFVGSGFSPDRLARGWAGQPFVQNAPLLRQGKQGKKAAPPTSTSARDVARKLEGHYRRTKTMEAVFLEKYTSGGAGIRAESGKVYFSRPGRMRWDYDSPEKKMFLVDGKHVWYYVLGDHTASRTSIKDSSDWRTPLALLTGKVNLDKLCGSLGVAGDAPADAKDGARGATDAGNEVLICKPRKEDRDAFSEVFFELNPRDQLVRVTIRQPGDIETEFRFGDWQENEPIAEGEFHFEPPAGVAIVDDAALANRAQ